MTWTGLHYEMLQEVTDWIRTFRDLDNKEAYIEKNADMESDGEDLALNGDQSENEMHQRTKRKRSYQRPVPFLYSEGKFNLYLIFQSFLT